MGLLNEVINAALASTQAGSGERRTENQPANDQFSQLGRALIKLGAKGGLMPAGRTPGNSPRVCRSEWQCVGNA